MKLILMYNDNYINDRMNNNNNELRDEVMEAVSKVMRNYEMKQFIKNIPDTIIEELNKNYERMSGCEFADYINHKLYAFIMELCNKYDLILKPKYKHWEDLKDLEDMDDTRFCDECGKHLDIDEEALNHSCIMTITDEKGRRIYSEELSRCKRCWSDKLGINDEDL
jgi:hypothetical protein